MKKEKYILCEIAVYYLFSSVKGNVTIEGIKIWIPIMTECGVMGIITVSVGNNCLGGGTCQGHGDFF